MERKPKMATYIDGSELKVPKPYRLYELYNIVRPYMEELQSKMNGDTIPIISLDYVKQLYGKEIQNRTLYINLISVFGALGFTVSKMDIDGTGDVGIVVKKIAKAEDYFSIPSYYKKRSEQLRDYLMTIKDAKPIRRTTI